MPLEKQEPVSLEKAQEFYDWLQGGSAPGGFEFQNPPKLPPEQAFAVLYYLQEYLGVIPDNYEACKKCGQLYDSYEEGTSVSDDTMITTDNGEEVPAEFPEHMHGNYCDECRPNWINKPYPEWMKE